jgi:protoporphyrinogen/coproporphyrinogen III oxidase
MDMVFRLNPSISDQVALIPKTSPAAKNRFIYFNDRLNKVPTSIWEMLWNPPPVMSGVVSGALLEAFKKPSLKKDESIHEFVSRRLGVKTAENVIQAIVHGYGSKLSIKKPQFL